MVMTVSEYKSLPRMILAQSRETRAALSRARVGSSAKISDFSFGGSESNGELAGDRAAEGESAMMMKLMLKERRK